MRNQPEEWKEAEVEIEETPVEEIKEDIRGIGISDFTSGEVRRPDDESVMSGFNTTVRGPRFYAVNKIHRNRSERAKDVDEQQNAPITTDAEKWLENPNRYDYPGVDTISRRYRRKRSDVAASEVEEKGMVDRIEQKGQAKNLRGKFSPRGSDTYGAGESVVRVQNTAVEESRVLAHELGHAIDYEFDEDKRYGLSRELFEGDARSDLADDPSGDTSKSELEEQAMQLSKQARGEFSEGGRYGASYRRDYKELAADAIGMAVMQPRATKRDAPELFDRLERAAEEKGLDIFGRDDDEDRFGFFEF